MSFREELKEVLICVDPDDRGWVSEEIISLIEKELVPDSVNADDYFDYDGWNNCRREILERLRK